MVLPLLGILGLGAAAGIKPSYDNWAASKRGEYADRAREGVDPNDATAMGGALFGAGLLSGAEYQSDIRGAYEGAQGRANAIERAHINNAPAFARLAHQKGQDAYERNKQEAYDANLQAAMADANIPQPLWGLKSAQQGFEIATQAKINAEFGPQYAGSVTEQRDQALAGAAHEQWLDQQAAQAERDQEAEQRRIDTRDEQRAYDANLAETERQRVQASTPTIEVPGQEVVDTIAVLDTTTGAIDALDDALLKIADENWLQRAGGADVAAMDARLQKTVLPWIQQLAETGALTDAEAERYTDDLSVSGRGGHKTAVLQAIQDVAKDFRGTQQRRLELITTAQQRQQGAVGRASGTPPPPPGTVAGPSGQSQ